MLPGCRYFAYCAPLQPGVDADVAGPFRVHRDIVAKALVLQRAGQLDPLLQRLLKPAFLQPRIRAVQLEPPLAGQRDVAGLGGQRRVSKEPMKHVPTMS